MSWPFAKQSRSNFSLGECGVVVRQREAEEQGVGAEDFLEIVDDGDGAAFAHQDGFTAEGGFERAQRGLGLRAVGGNQIGFARRGRT